MQERYWRVDILESEAGWGSKIDDSDYYKSEEEAQTYVTDYNKRYNNKKVTPSWYMVALPPEPVDDFKTVTKLNSYFNYHFDESSCSRDELREYEETDNKGS